MPAVTRLALRARSSPAFKATLPPATTVVDTCWTWSSWLVTFFVLLAECCSLAADIRFRSPVAVIATSRLASIALAMAVISRPALMVRSRPTCRFEPFWVTLLLV
ncbi:hypothetical protein D3C81_1525710 [compost metagenome]